MVTLSRGLELQGRLAGPDGVPLAGVAVTLAEDGTIGGTLVPIHVALAVDKADSFRTIEDLSRGLEEKVRVRTEQLRAANEEP